MKTVFTGTVLGNRIKIRNGTIIRSETTSPPPTAIWCATDSDLQLSTDKKTLSGSFSHYNCAVRGAGTVAYQLIQNAEIGDVVVYQDNDSNFIHVAVITNVEQNSDGTTTILSVRSKHGDKPGIHEEDPSKTGYGNNWTVWHRKAKKYGCRLEMCNALNLGTFPDPQQFRLKSATYFVTDKGRRIVVDCRLINSSGEETGQNSTAQCMEMAQNHENDTQLDFDCRGFVFGGGLHVKIPDGNGWVDQTKRILDDGYEQRINVVDTNHNKHY
jgi:hypothetical protein